jgi:hypothetical protein
LRNGLPTIRFRKATKRYQHSDLTLFTHYVTGSMNESYITSRQITSNLRVETVTWSTLRFNSIEHLNWIKFSLMDDWRVLISITSLSWICKAKWLSFTKFWRSESNWYWLDVRVIRKLHFPVPSTALELDQWHTPSFFSVRSSYPVVSNHLMAFSLSFTASSHWQVKSLPWTWSDERCGLITLYRSVNKMRKAFLDGPLRPLRMLELTLKYATARAYLNQVSCNEVQHT